MAEKKVMISITDRLKTKISLIKVSISLMSAAAAVTGYSMRLPVFTETAILTAAGVFCIAAGSSVMNNYQDRIADSMMERTKKRPLPSGEVTPGSAVVQSVILVTTGVVILTIISGSLLPAAAAIFAMVLYNGIYTQFKKHIFVSFISGIFSGMIPPLLGWFTAGGTVPSVQVMYFMILIGVWQVPHTWLILLRYRDDYSKAGISTILDIISAGRLKIILFLWALSYALLTLFVKFFFSNISVLNSVLLIINALVITAVFFTNLIIKKSDGVYAPLFHQLNISMAGVTLITASYSHHF